MEDQSEALYESLGGFVLNNIASNSTIFRKMSGDKTPRQLKVYLSKLALPTPCVWPTWYYFKKLIAQEVNEDSPLLSMIPEQGPFHVTLNAQENIMQIYHSILSNV